MRVTTKKVIMVISILFLLYIITIVPWRRLLDIYNTRSTSMELKQHSRPVIVKNAEEVKRARLVHRRIKQQMNWTELYQNILKYFQLSVFDKRDPLLNKHEFVYILDSKVCDVHDLYVLAFVHSSPEKMKERMMIRNSWGGHKIIGDKHIGTIFMLGECNNNSKLQDNIKEEAEKFGDIVQGNFKDSYRNLTYKHIMAISWIISHCSEVPYILKTDDDTMVNIYKMVYFLQTQIIFKQFIYCSPYIRHGPVRYKNDKWTVSFTEYPFIKYPNYCEGFAYISTPISLTKLLISSTNLKYYWIDDVYVTGILNIRPNIPLTAMKNNYSYTHMKKEIVGPAVNYYMFLLARYDYMKSNWEDSWLAIIKYST